MYGKCGCVEMAKEVFKMIPSKSVVAWNSMIAVYGSINDSRECIALFERMNVEGTKPTPTTLSSILMACARSAQLQHGTFIHGYIIRNKIDVDSFVNGTLIDLYFKCGRINLAENIFQLIPKADVVCWNVLISGYVTVGCYQRALDIYDDMIVAALKPNAATFASILSACSQLAALEKGKQIHNMMMEVGLGNNEVVMGALLDMYSKCGAIDEALSVFYKLPERDLVSWTSMINAYGLHGQALEALKLFSQMQQLHIRPDRVTFLAVLSACSHAGLADEGYNYFTEMMTGYGIEPTIEHYSCLIDLLGRAGRLSEAYKIIQGTQEFRQDINLLSTLLSACHLHKDFKLGEKIAKLLIKKDRFCLSTYITLSNMYASAKKWDEVGRVRLKMKKLRMKKNHGCSWIEIDKKIQSFFSEDRSNPEAGMVSRCLKMLTSHMEMDDMPPCQQSKRGLLEETIVFN
uniref:Pentatricopeptide repeat-containing protein n=1 Tax=Rhizophora mucronata TaxID=61149 RepID=A0A2P2IR31_RHIMU